ncbi:MAG: T6SS phospholipase effector Tle1-like catalytic domain-containing protein [Rhodanobacteraceae bacterium]
MFIHANNPHEYLYVASFDGTGNDKLKDPEHETNVAKVDDQIERVMHGGNDHLGRGYVPGPGTQDNSLARTLDGLQGSTYDARVEKMYKLFIDHAWIWKQADPQAEIRLADIGFSRGGDEAAGFARLVHERGIQNPAGAHYTYDRNHQITRVAYIRPPLVAPGKVAQVALLFDPVGTGVPEQHHDRRLPPSVISGIQIIAADERRGAYKSDHIIDPGVAENGRLLGLIVAGAHSDIGGAYDRNGLGIRSGNLGIDFLSALSDKPFLAVEKEPDDPRLNVVHRSEYGSVFDRIYPKVDRSTVHGYNELLVPWGTEAQVTDPYNAEPRDEALNSQFEHQFVDTGLQPAPHDVARVPDSALSSRLNWVIGAAKADDWVTFSRGNEALGYGAAGRAMLDRAEAQAAWLEQQAVEQAAHQGAGQQRAAQQAQPVMQH